MGQKSIGKSPEKSIFTGLVARLKANFRVGFRKKLIREKFNKNSTKIFL
jgi:hypothetical protein